MYVGYSGTRHLHADRAEHGLQLQRQRLYLGYNSGGTGTYSLSGGKLSAYSQYVGYSGAGAVHPVGRDQHCRRQLHSRL